MKFFDMLKERFIERRVRKYGKGCARAMAISALTMKQHYEGVAPTYAWLARKALTTRPHWQQMGETTFIYELAPPSVGIIDIDDSMSLWDVIQKIIEMELYWYYLKDLEMWRKDELIELSLNEAGKYLKVKKTHHSDDREGAENG